MSFPSTFPYTENATSSSGSNVPEKYDRRRGQVATCEEWISGRKWGLFDGSVVVVACVSCGQGEVIWISYPTVHPYPKVEAVKEKKPDFTTAIHDTVVHNKFIHSSSIIMVPRIHSIPSPLMDSLLVLQVAKCIQIYANLVELKNFGWKFGCCDRY